MGARVQNARLEAKSTMQVEVPSENGLSMDPNVWGPPLWDMLFSISFHAPAESYPDLQHIFVLLEKVMPCSHCRRSYSMYRKQLKPTTCIRKTDPSSAPIWLWTIHDMVNQKLGKICISFDKLQKRHGSISMLTNDLIVCDVFSIISESVKKELRGAATDFIMAVSRVLKTINPSFFKIPGLLERMPLQVESLQADVWKLNNAVRRNYGFHKQEYEDYKSRMRGAVA